MRQEFINATNITAMFHGKVEFNVNGKTIYVQNPEYKHVSFYKVDGRGETWLGFLKFNEDGTHTIEPASENKLQLLNDAVARFIDDEFLQYQLMDDVRDYMERRMVRLQKELDNIRIDANLVDEFLKTKSHE